MGLGYGGGDPAVESVKMLYEGPPEVLRPIRRRCRHVVKEMLFCMKHEAGTRVCSRRAAA